MPDDLPIPVRVLPAIVRIHLGRMLLAVASACAALRRPTDETMADLELIGEARRMVRDEYEAERRRRARRRRRRAAAR